MTQLPNKQLTIAIYILSWLKERGYKIIVASQAYIHFCQDSPFGVPHEPAWIYLFKDHLYVRGREDARNPNIHYADTDFEQKLIKAIQESNP